jgi:CheY-like chemotaxis protein
MQEGLSVPRVLVADDNSNIHRMVSLALKESGVDVVAVGNGEAAVRKIGEIQPDLVLADIFMPVRNGYEVCEFVKQDQRYAQTPVVLLIGAFDPFDEREAQRVHADGILKKPFVPPEPLIRMVKDLLAQSAARSAPVPVAAAASKKAERAGNTDTSVPAQQPAVEELEEISPEQTAPAKADFDWSVAEKPVAFSTLLETPSPEIADEVVTAQRDPNLGEPAFWSETTRTDGSPAEGSIEDEPWDDGPGLLSVPDEFADIETLQPPAAVQDMSPNVVEEAVPLDQEAAPSSEIPAIVPPQSLAVPSPEPAPPDNSTSAFLAELLPAIKGFEETPEAEPEAELESDAAPSLEDFSWANPSFPTGGSNRHAEAESETKALTEVASPGLATLATVSPTQEQDTETAAETESEPGSPASDPATYKTDEGLVATPASRLPPEEIEVITERVIERMRPKVMELVTRELLRPIVEALVQRELDKK